MAPRTTFKYKPEETKLKHEMLLSPTDTTFWFFEIEIEISLFSVMENTNITWGSRPHKYMHFKVHWYRAQYIYLFIFKMFLVCLAFSALWQLQMIVAFL